MSFDRQIYNIGHIRPMTTWWQDADFIGLSPQSIYKLQAHFDVAGEGSLWGYEFARQMLARYHYADADEYTYFMYIPEFPGCLKIGFSKDPIDRAVRLGGYLVAVFPHNQEAHFHRRFDRYRVERQAFKGGGELFQVPDRSDILGFLRQQEKSVDLFFDGIKEKYLRRASWWHSIAGGHAAPELCARDPWGEPILYADPREVFPNRPQPSATPPCGIDCQCEKCMGRAAYIFQQHALGGYDCRCPNCTTYLERAYKDNEQDGRG